MTAPAKVCYFVQTHRDPEQIYRLVRTLRRGSASGTVVVQHNSAACPLDWSPLGGLADVHRFEAAAPQLRANYSCQVQPLLDVIDWLQATGVSYDWLVTLTGQDYPVKPVERIETELAASDDDGYLRYWDVASNDNPWPRRKARNRYFHHYRRLPAAAEPWLRASRLLTKVLPIHFYLDYGPLVGVRSRGTPFHNGFRCYGGWAWFSLRRRAVAYFRRFLAEHPDVEAHYRRTVTPEESLVQTVLLNAGEFRLVNDDRRYIDYSRAHRGSPRTLTTADLAMLAAGSDHFARKFDLGVDAEVLDRIDRELLGAAG